MTKHVITKYREKHGLTLEAFGKLVNCQRAAVHQWENGKGPSVETAIAIDKATKGEVSKRALLPEIWRK